MSWSGFKKNVGRATTQVMMKTGQVEKTNDRQYEVEERRYRTLESASLRLQKEAKGYLDSLRAMTASQMRIAETIDAFYGDSGATDGVSRSYKQAVEDLDAETVKALDGPYRTTVLDPINRFCAYFPDINECIKKRQHKMLDYDSMRSKVKRLTEKPDKDPAKLPRTEKEQDMVSLTDFLRDTPPSGSASTNRESSMSALSAKTNTDFTLPSPPKALNGIRQRLGLTPEYDGEETETINEDSELLLSPTRGRRARKSLLARTSSILSSYSSLLSSPAETDTVKGTPERSHRRHSSSGTFRLCRPSPEGPSPKRSISAQIDRRLSRSSSIYLRKSQSAVNSSPWARDSTSTRGGTWPREARVSKTFSTPWFEPSELEEIMAPLKVDFVRKQADNLEQAKAAYDQLNEQLMSELPQLIDLRVPYLDPTFEALVKIQLRFCAEAYSRMAQVQQYLDASTRDQYASGDLDGRVEDVLGQIRELSIAGTV